MSEEKKPDKEISFEEKYGLVGKGKPCGISKETREEVLALHKLSDAAIMAGEAEAKLNKTKYR